MQWPISLSLSSLYLHLTRMDTHINENRIEKQLINISGSVSKHVQSEIIVHQCGISGILLTEKTKWYFSNSKKHDLPVLKKQCINVPKDNGPFEVMIQSKIEAKFIDFASAPRKGHLMWLKATYNASQIMQVRKRHVSYFQNRRWVKQMNILIKLPTEIITLIPPTGFKEPEPLTLIPILHCQIL